MRLSNNLKNRLPLINLLFFALVLGGGVFFWHQSQQRLQLHQLDAQLTLAADLFISDLANGDQCKRIEQFNKTNKRIQLNLFNRDETPLCDESLATIPAHSQSNRIITREIPGSQRTIQAMGSNNSLEKQSPSLPIALISVFLLAVFYYLQQQLTRSRSSEIQALIDQLEPNEESQTAAELEPQSISDPLLQRLVSGHNRHIADISDSLTRAHQFTANVTHELRTPLTILRGESELALRSERSNEQLRRVLDSNLEEISRMSRLIDDLLLLSKSELGEIPIRHDLLYLAELILELQHQAKILGKSKNISILLDWETGKDIYLAADNFRLRQVFLNLLTNAIRYTPDGGTITIRIIPQGQNVEISIIDTGIGIDAEHLEHIFERFYRIDKDKNRDDGGSGLGLAIVHWIVEAHEGRISAQSQLGEGSCFSVTLPTTIDFAT